MKFEHFALNVRDARNVAAWYADHLGLAVLRSQTSEPHTHFLADETGRVVVEFYTNRAATIPDYEQAHPLSFHVGFVATDARATQRRLELAGAKLYKEDQLPDGSILIMMRDPWHLPLQLCQRAKPF
jgi:glyoxylase I family protein